MILVSSICSCFFVHFVVIALLKSFIGFSLVKEGIQSLWDLRHILWGKIIPKASFVYQISLLSFKFCFLAMVILTSLRYLKLNVSDSKFYIFPHHIHFLICVPCLSLLPPFHPFPSCQSHNPRYLWMNVFTSLHSFTITPSQGTAFSSPVSDSLQGSLYYLPSCSLQFICYFLQLEWYF